MDIKENVDFDLLARHHGALHQAVYARWHSGRRGGVGARTPVGGIPELGRVERETYTLLTGRDVPHATPTDPTQRGPLVPTTWCPERTEEGGGPVSHTVPLAAVVADTAVRVAVVDVVDRAVVVPGRRVDPLGRDRRVVGKTRETKRAAVLETRCRRRHENGSCRKDPVFRLVSSVDRGHRNKSDESSFGKSVLQSCTGRGWGRIRRSHQ